MSTRPKYNSVHRPQPLRWTATILAACSLLADSPAHADAPVRSAPQQIPALPAEYQLLTRRSIFDRSRNTPPPPATPAAPAKPPAVLVLIGVLLTDSGYMAYLENPQTHQLIAISEGAKLPQARGTLKSANRRY